MQSLKSSAAIFLLVLSSGCAIKYFDQKTGVYNLWGAGHIKIKISEPEEGVRGVVVGEELIGLGLRIDEDEIPTTSLSVGYSSRDRMKIMDDTAVKLIWNSDDLFDVDIGSIPPLEIKYDAKGEKM